MTDAMQMFEYRYARFIGDAFDQTFTTAWHDNVDALPQRDQFTNRSTVGGVDDLYRVFGQSSCTQTLVHAGTDRAIRFDCLGAAAENHRIACFQAQAGRVRGHVRPRLINDTDDTQWHAHVPNLNPTRAVTHVGNFANWIGQPCDLTQAVRHRCDAALVQC